MNIMIDLCQNYENGWPSGKVSQITFSKNLETIAHLESNDIAGEPCLTNDRIIEMYGARIKHNGRTLHTGNIFWNAYCVPLAYALGLINLLADRAEWTVFEAWGSVFYKFQNHEEITGSDFDCDDIKGEVIILNQKTIQF